MVLNVEWNIRIWNIQSDIKENYVAFEKRKIRKNRHSGDKLRRLWIKKTWIEKWFSLNKCKNMFWTINKQNSCLIDRHLPWWIHLANALVAQPFSLLLCQSFFEVQFVGWSEGLPKNDKKGYRSMRIKWVMSKSKFTYVNV